MPTALRVLLMAFGLAPLSLAPDTTSSNALTVPTSVSTSVPASVPRGRKTVAVLAFDNNTGKSDYDHLGKGMASMMTTDLAAVNDIQLVERERLADVTKEIDQQRSRYFDSTTAVKVGQLSGAQYIVIGSIAAVNPQMRIDTRIIRVETGAIVKSANVTGHEEKFFDLEKKLARQLVKDLDIALTPEDEAKLDARQEANRMDDLDAVVKLSNAMSLADAGDYGGATLKIAPVVAKYPNSTFVKLTADEIKKRAAESSKTKAKNGINNGINKLIKRKWPPVN